MSFQSEDQLYVGNCGSDNMLITEQIFDRFQYSPMVFLWRDPQAIQMSLESCGVPQLPPWLLDRGEACMEFVRTHGGLVIDTSQWTPSSTRQLWDHCIPDVPYPKERNHQLEYTRSEITPERWKYLESRAGKWPFQGL